MSKKRYIIITLLTSLLFLLILPIINYKHNQWRVLPKDYAYAYDDIAINKSYLKTAYLLEHLNRYDTLLFGSSRNAAFVETDIAPRAYNAYADFCVVGQQLHMLKILLKHKMPLKEVWIAINDFDIWKDPKDFEKDYSKRVYREDLKGKLDFYKLYLFKALDNNDLKIAEGKYKLTLSNRIFRKNLDKEFKPELIKKEASLQAKGMKWRKKLTASAATLLGYQDTPESYRIDKTIQEIKEIKELCDNNHIKVNFFFYPTFYKTYLMYNQYKIEEFKRKLIKVTEFYDFYRLNKIAFDETKWNDTSHFVYSVGLNIIRAIRNKRDLVTKDNYKTVLKNERKNIALLLDKKLPIPYIMRFNGHIPLENMHTIYTFKDGNFTPNNQTKITLYTKEAKIESLGNDPYILFAPIQANSENVILHCEITSESKTLFQLFYKRNKKVNYNEHDSVKVWLYKGVNSFNLLIPSKWLQEQFRIDPGQKKGVYHIKTLQILSH